VDSCFVDCEIFLDTVRYVIVSGSMDMVRNSWWQVHGTVRHAFVSVLEDGRSWVRYVPRYDMYLSTICTWVRYVLIC
jgi:hypothetical protein